MINLIFFNATRIRVFPWLVGMSIQIRECEFGKGVFAIKSIKSDELIWKLVGEPVSIPTRTTIYIGNDEHVDDPHGIYFNRLNQIVKSKGGALLLSLI